MSNTFSKVIKFLSDKKYRTIVNAIRGKYSDLSDEEYLKYVFPILVGYNLNLNNPTTYNEKLQWLKLYDRRNEYVSFVDKYEVKGIVEKKIGKEYIIPTLGVWNSFDDIDWEQLPKQFVLKCTHDSGGIIICKDKESLDKTAAKKKIVESLNREYFLLGREWPYKMVKPRIICEEYIEDCNSKELLDYKFFAFDGEVKALFIASDRQSKNTETKFDFFDSDFNHLDILNGHPMADVTPSKPKNFELMKDLASKLSKGYPHIRVDFYEVNGKVYFGELTLYHWSGFKPFCPDKWDAVFGSWLKLPNN